MVKTSSENKKKKLKSERRNNIWDWIIGFILAVITMMAIPETFLGLITIIPKIKNEVGEYWLGWIWIAYLLAIVITIIVIWGYIVKIKILFINQRAEFEYRREEKINSINRVVFDALYSSNSAKITEIFRYTYGCIQPSRPVSKDAIPGHVGT